MAVSTQRSGVSAILAKLEDVYATDPVPTPADNGILINEGADITPSADKEARTIIRTTFSPAGSFIGAKSVEMSIETELRGGGLDADGITPLPPDFDPLLQCCGMSRTPVLRLGLSGAGAWVAGEEVTGGTSAAKGRVEYIERDILLVITVTTGTFGAAETITGGTSLATAGITSLAHGLMYKPVTAAPSVQKSVAIYFHKDAILHRLIGGIGTFSLDGQVGKLAKLAFKISGLWVDPADGVLPSPKLTDIQGLQALNMGVMIGNYTPVCTALKLDLGAKVEKRQNINSASGLVGLLITGREPSGSLDPEVDTLAHFNPWTPWQSGAKAKINGYLGSTPGNRMAFHVGAAQYTDLKYASRVGLSNYSLGFTPCQERVGDDEMRFTFF